jgi:hypothetical protein
MLPVRDCDNRGKVFILEKKTSKVPLSQKKLSLNEVFEHSADSSL